MLHKYRKTALIEAEQFDGSDEMANKYGVLWDLDGVRIYWIPYLPTKKGKMFIKKGDWIATGVDGEHWVIDKDVFKRTYERMN